MSKYLRKFETSDAYDAAENSLILPNVSYIVEGNEVHYKPYVKETKFVVYYDIQDTSSPTTIFTNYDKSVKSIEVDGKETISEFSQGNVTYQFDSVGEHIIKYEFNNPTSVGNNAPLFMGLTTIKRAVIADTFTSIGANAFYNCSSLTSITIPDSVTSIGKSAFSGCTGLTSVTIGSGVTSIGEDAFTGCSGLTSIVVDSANTVLDSRNNCNAIINKSTNELIVGCKNTVIPNTVTSIGKSAFQGCTGLTSVTIGSGVTSIGDEAFFGCTGLTSITIPSSITSVSDYVFNGCTSLTSITIPDSVTSIGTYAFQGCTGLTSITIPSSVTSIGNSAFFNCTGLTNITSLAAKAPTIQSWTFNGVKIGGTLTVPSGSTGYDVWMGTGNYYLGKFNWTKVEQ